MTTAPSIKEIFEWDYINWSRALSFWVKYSPVNPQGSNALELGARNGGLSLWFAALGCEVICSDLEGPTESARELHKKYGLNFKIKYAAVDATKIEYENLFDIVFFKSVLGGIGRNGKHELQIKAIDQIYKALKPGGVLCFAENLIASPFHRFFRKRFVRWGESWRYVSIDEMHELLSQFTQVNFIATGFFAAFGRKEWQRTFLGYIDRFLFDYIVPASWRYIIIGVARK